VGNREYKPERNVEKSNMQGVRSYRNGNFRTSSIKKERGNKLNNLTLINTNGKFTVDSREVAEMVGKDHKNLLRDICKYVDILKDPGSNLSAANFFELSSYIDNQNQTRPCFLLTRKGCDMVANKMTGEKGVLFTATYVTKFEEMEQTLKTPAVKQMTQSELIFGLAQCNVELEKKVTALDTRFTNAIDIFTAPSKDDWKHDINSKINQIIESQGLNHQKFRGDLYEELELLAHCNVTARQSNLRKRMKENGATYKDCQAATKLDVVDRDVQLKPIFEGIVRKYQAKYAMAV